jgi:hypothetical protein
MSVKVPLFKGDLGGSPPITTKPIKERKHALGRRGRDLRFASFVVCNKHMAFLA